MRHLVFILVLAFQLTLGCCQESKNPSSVLEWQETSTTNKPWTRWWWHGNSVTKVGISHELEAFEKAGLGGVEITPIYGQVGDEENFIEFLSAQWMAMLEHTLAEADRLGLGVDMATGTGWPFGGPWVSDQMSSKYITLEKYSLSGGQSLSDPIRHNQSPILRTVRRSDLQLTDLKQPIQQNTDLQELAIDQVRFENPMNLQALMAYEADSESVNLLSLVDSTGKLNWTAPPGKWTLYAVFQGMHGKMVERAAPGGEGYVIDHFSGESLQGYLSKFDEAFSPNTYTSLRAFFNDSYEVDDAQGEANYTTGLFEEFKERRGYDLQDHLPALWEDTHELHERILSDYRETLAELILAKFTQPWTQWAHDKDKLVRNQAHGSPANILDLYATVDIPETEGTDIQRIKMATSAAHLTNKPLTSAEAATWLGEHFTTNLADLKENLDRYLVGGVNHIFYHGSCYSPPDEPWPGRLFYAAIHANPRNPLWHHMAPFNSYVARVQSLLQAGRPDNDVLLYFPAHDRFATTGRELLEHFDGFAMNRHESNKTPVRQLAEDLWLAGYAFDFVSDKQLYTLNLEDGKLSSGDNTYKAIVVPQTEYMPLETTEWLAEMAEQGIPIIIDQSLPGSAPGLMGLHRDASAFQKAQAQLEEAAILARDDVLGSLHAEGVHREKLVDHGLEYIRRKAGTDHVYYVTNWSGTDWGGWVTLSTEAASIEILDPISGKTGLASHRPDASTGTQVYLQIANGSSLLLKTTTAQVESVDWKYYEAKEPSIHLNASWSLSFLQDGSTIPTNIGLDSIRPWTEVGNKTLLGFSGTAKYRCTFEHPNQSADGWRIDLGAVHECSSVTLNGHKLGDTFGPSHTTDLDSALLMETNTLEIEVSNLMANRLIAMENEGHRWQNFYNINISANKRENVGKDGVFTTKDWEPLVSGIRGPVKLLPLEQLDPLQR